MDYSLIDTKEYFTNLSTETSSEQQMMSHLATTNTSLTAQQATKDIDITHILSKMATNTQHIPTNNIDVRTT